MDSKMTASAFIERLKAIGSPEEAEKTKGYFKTGEGQYGEGDEFIGVRMGKLFELAKEFLPMPVGEIEKLLESPIHEVRAGAVSIMDKQSRNKKTTENRRKEIFDLYMRRHDRINNWDLVDLGALHMVGSYLYDKPRDILYQLATSGNVWERRSAIVGTTYFIRQGDVADTFRIAEMLVNDGHDLVHKGTGWMLRFAGDKDREQLLAFLDKHAATMPRTLLRYAIEKFDKPLRGHYMGMKKANT
ncbi:MAG TPA: DNA alkylation repair protein [Flavobacterium sp.]|nr:DNA alkylation repair protein [Flavobacterium sp.]